jgi:hypothetical protein
MELMMAWQQERTAAKLRADGRLPAGAGPESRCDQRDQNKAAAVP